MGCSSSLEFEIALLGSINLGGIFLMRLKFEHALLVRGWDVFETTYPDSLVSMIFQADSVRDRFSPLYWQ